MRRRVRAGDPAAVAAIPGGVRRVLLSSLIPLPRCRSRRDSGGREADQPLIIVGQLLAGRSRRDSGGREAASALRLAVPCRSRRDSGGREADVRAFGSAWAAVAAIPGGVRRLSAAACSVVAPQSPRFRGA